MSQIHRESEVAIRFRNQNLVFEFNPDTEFEKLLMEFEDKIKKLKTALDGFRGSLEVKGRLITEDEKNKIFDVLKRNAKISIEYLYCNHEQLKKRQDLPAFSINEGMTKFHRGTLRSGSKIQYRGNVVLFGDLNPGAVIEAQGNVIVLGKISGTVFAGYDSDEKAVIIGLNFNPVLMKIGTCIANNPNQGVLANRKNLGTGLEIAFVIDSQIKITDYDKKLDF